jgi:hypothetical protein
LGGWESKQVFTQQKIAGAGDRQQAEALVVVRLVGLVARPNYFFDVVFVDFIFIFDSIQLFQS